MVHLVHHDAAVARHDEPERERAGGRLAERTIGEQPVVRHQHHPAATLIGERHRHRADASRRQQSVHRAYGREPCN